KAILVTSYDKFVREFGDLKETGHFGHAIYGYFQNGGSRAFVCNVGPKTEGQTDEDLAALIKGEDNGPGFRSGLNVFKTIEDISMVACPGATSTLLHQLVADFCSACGDRVAILDGIEELGGIQLNDFPRIGDNPNASLYWPWIT